MGSSGESMPEGREARLRRHFEIAAPSPDLILAESSIGPSGELLGLWTSPAGAQALGSVTINDSSGSGIGVFHVAFQGDHVTSLATDASGNLYDLDTQGISEFVRVPIAPPDAPSNVKVQSSPGSGQVTVSWRIGATNGTPVGATVVTASPGGSTCSGVSSSATSCGMTLPVGVAYTFSVATGSAAGKSIATTVGPVTLVGAPGAPTNVSVSSSGNQAIVSWSPPVNDGGATITGYTVLASPSATVVCTTTGAVTCVASGLTVATTVTFAVQATNTWGQGPFSAYSSPFVVLGPPPAPTSVNVAPISNGIKVNWSAPTATGGSPITSYVVRSTTGTTLCTTTQLTCSATGLSRSNLIQVQVAAVSSRGTGTFSASTTAVYPTTSSLLQLLPSSAIGGVGSTVSVGIIGGKPGSKVVIKGAKSPSCTLNIFGQCTVQAGASKAGKLLISAVNGTLKASVSLSIVQATVPKSAVSGHTFLVSIAGGPPGATVSVVFGTDHAVTAVCSGKGAASLSPVASTKGVQPVVVTVGGIQILSATIKVN